MCERGNYRRFTHKVLLRLPFDVDRVSIATMLQLLLDGPRLVTREPGVVSAADLLDRIELTGAGNDELCSVIARSARESDPRVGVWAVWLPGAESGGAVLLATHHLTVDRVPWHVMLGDVTEAWHAMNPAWRRRCSGSSPRTAAGRT